MNEWKKRRSKEKFFLEIFGSGKGRFCLNLKKKIEDEEHKMMM